MPLKAILAGGALLSLAATAAEAHHSINGTIDLDQYLEAEAVLTKVDWINPHAWLHFDMTAADGAILKGVMFESLGVSGMRRAGISDAAAFTIGQAYTISYYPNRSGRPGGYVVRLEEPDGTVLGLTVKIPRRLPGRR